MTNYQFDQSAVEVIVLCLVRLIVLGTVLLRSRACLVRVKMDGTIKPSLEAMAALWICGLSAAYCVFKVCHALLFVSPRQ